METILLQDKLQQDQSIKNLHLTTYISVFFLPSYAVNTGLCRSLRITHIPYCGQHQEAVNRRKDGQATNPNPNPNYK